MDHKNYDETHKLLDQAVSRRRFMSSVGAATAGLALASCSKKDPAPTAPTNNDPVVPEGSSTVASMDVSTYEPATIKKAVEDALDKLGGLGDIIKSGDTVGMKINLTGGEGSARSWEGTSGTTAPTSYWTHPEIMKAVGECVLDAGAGKLYVVEAIYDQASLTFWGYLTVINGLGAQFVDLNGKTPFPDYVERPVGSNAFIYDTLTQNGILDEMDCFISLAKSKQHHGGGVTHGMKNLVGTLPVPSGKYNAGQGHRAGIHQHRTATDNNTNSNLRRVILDLNNATPINLVVNDAIWTVLGGEGPWNRPSITPRHFNKLIVSKDPVAADAIATQAIGFDPTAADNTGVFASYGEGINYLKLASELGMGNYDPEKIVVV